MGNKPIQELHINYFKFFTDNEPIKINGNHVLLYGENGSGKSSIYWALYTLLEAVLKSEHDLNKYFNVAENNNLINLSKPTTTEPFVNLTLHDGPTYRISSTDFSVKDLPNAQSTLRGSDFINYRFIFKLSDFRHNEEIDLFDLFEKEVFPYVKTRGNIDLIHEERTSNDFSEIWEDLKKGRDKSDEEGGITTNASINMSYYVQKLDVFISEINRLLGDITRFGNSILSQALGYPYIRYELTCTQAYREPASQKFPERRPKINLYIPEYNGSQIHRPHSFLNEAKWTAIGIAIRFAIVDIRQDYAENADFQLLVLDDLLVSLDMSNREKVLELIFSQYLSNYQVFILTHDRVLFEFVRAFIKQKSNREAWTLLEMYEGDDVNKMVKQPVIIDSKANYLEKAESYFKAKDYTACAFYLRKEVERLVKARLTEDHTRIFQEDQKPHTLKYLWDKMCERYQTLKSPIDSDLKSKFESSKLLVMNAQAHDNLSSPVYKLEIEKALGVVNDIAALVIPNKTILLIKGMQMRFQHPHQNYSFDFELLGDFYIDNLGAINGINFPKCKILTWQFEESEFWNFIKQQIEIPQKQREESFSKILSNLLKIEALNNTREIILKHTKQIDGIWSLEDIIDKAGIQLNIP